MKDHIKVLKDHIFTKDSKARHITDTNIHQHMTICLCVLILSKTIKTTSKIKSKALMSEIKASLSLPLSAITGNILQQKSVVIVTDNSDLDRQ